MLFNFRSKQNSDPESALRLLLFDSLRHLADDLGMEVYALTPDARVCYVNDLVINRYGILRDNGFLPFDIRNINREMTAERFKGLLEESDRNGGRFTTRSVHTLPGGGQMDVLLSIYKAVSDDPSAYTWVVAREITDEIRREHRLNRMSHILNVLLENAPLQVYIKDGADLRYIYWSRSMEEVSGLSADEAIGRTTGEVFTDREFVRRINSVDAGLQKKGGIIEQIHELEERNGRHTLKTIKSFVPGTANVPSMIVGFSIDITDMKETEQGLIRERLSVDRFSNLKNVIISGLGRNILASFGDIAGFMRTMSRDNNPVSREEQYKAIEADIGKLMRGIGEVINISNTETGCAEADVNIFGVEELFRRVHDNLSPVMAKGVDLIMDPSSVAIKIEGDEKRIEQVLADLIAEAKDHVSDGCIHYGYSYGNGNLYVKVEERGAVSAGAGADGMAHMPSGRGDWYPESGTRPKMALCRIIVEMMGGKFTVSSASGGGLSVLFTVPCRLVESEPVDTENPALNACGLSADGKKKVLVAEDVDSNYMLLQALIGKSYNLRRAINGREAIEIFQEPGYSPDIILMDMKMPVMGGLEATRRIRGLSADVPVIALTANAFAEDRVEALAAGCNDFLAKPISAEGLRKIMEKYIDKG